MRVHSGGSDYEGIRGVSAGGLDVGSVKDHREKDIWAFPICNRFIHGFS